MNRDLASSNRDLTQLNNELHERSAESDRVQLLFTSVIDALDDAVIVLDGEGTVQAWNQRARLRSGA